MRGFFAAERRGFVIATILGGSAGSTPGLVDWLAKQKPAANMTIRLAGRTRDHLMAVTRASKLLATQTAVEVEAFESSGWDDALGDADIVIVQVRIGGLQGREFDESFPLQHGIPGDEGLGPGGLSAALRSWPKVRQILAKIQQIAPRCLPILLTSPGSLLVRLAASAFPDLPVYAICELPFTTLAEVCRTTSKPVDRVDFSYAGVNHLGWLYQIYHQGEDLIGPYCKQQTKSCIYRVIDEYGAVPLKYFHLHLEPARSAAEQLRKDTICSRAKRLAGIHHEAMEVFRNGNVEEIRVALARRSTLWYTEALGPLLLQFSDRERSAGWPDRPFFLSTADSDGAVSERAYQLQGKTFRAVPMASPPKPVWELNNSYMEYEKQAALSVEEPDLKKVKNALIVHPWISRTDQALALSEALWQGFQAFKEKREPT